MKHFATLLGICLVASRCLASDLPTASVLYHVVADSTEAGFAASLYHERRHTPGFDSQAARLARLGLALEMDFMETADNLLADLRDAELDEVDSRRLQLYLARHAYRRGNAGDLIAAMAGLPPQPSPGSWEVLLRAEAARWSNDSKEALQWLGAAGHDDALVAYGRFNLATSLAKGGDAAAAIRLLAPIARLRPTTGERLALVERARLALGQLHLQAGDPRAASGWLAPVGSASPAGPGGFAMMAMAAIDDADFRRAAGIFEVMLTRSPWHPEALGAHAALPWSIEQARGPAAALGDYRRARDRLSARLNALEGMPDVRPALVVGAVAGDAAALGAIETRFGDRAWIERLASERLRAAAARWTRLVDGAARLERYRDDLEIFATVGGEQRGRLEDARGSLSRQSFRGRLAEYRRRLASVDALLDELRDDPTGPDVPDRFATPTERRALLELDGLRAQAHSLNASSTVLDRIDHLEGVVRYSISNAISARIQARARRVERARETAAALQTRVARIERAALAISETAGLPARIERLEARRDRVADGLALALHETEKVLMASLEEMRVRQIAGIERQLLSVDLALARIEDERMVAERSP